MPCERAWRRLNRHLIGSAYPVDINWSEDSASSFALTIVGTGLSWTDTFTSPSGLWECTAWASGEYHPEIDPNNPIVIHHRGLMTFLGLPSHPTLYAPSYNDFFPISAPIFDNNRFRMTPLSLLDRLGATALSSSHHFQTQQTLQLGLG